MPRKNVGIPNSPLHPAPEAVSVTGLPASPYPSPTFTPIRANPGSLVGQMVGQAKNAAVIIVLFQ